MCPRCPRWDKRRWRHTLLWGSPTVDLIGLTTNGLALPTRNGVGSLYERWRKMPEEKRPDYFAIYPTWFPGFEVPGYWTRR